MPTEDGSDGELDEENKRKASRFQEENNASDPKCSIVYCTELDKSDGTLNSCAI